MSTGDKQIIAFANRSSLQYKQSRTYSAGSVCIKDGLFYEANDVIAGGTTFSEGTTGATWKLVGSKPIEDWAASTGYEVGDQVFAEAALWQCKTAHTSATTFADTNWDLKAGLFNETDFTIATETLNTVDFKAIKPNIAHEFLLGTSSLPFKAAYLEGIDFYTGTSYIGNIDADSDHLGIYSGTSTNTTTKLQLGTKNNTADISIEDASIVINKALNLNNSNLVKVNVITFNDIGVSEGIVWDDWIISQGYTNQLTFYSTRGATDNFNVASGSNSLSDSSNGFIVMDGSGSTPFFAPFAARNGEIYLGTSSRRWRQLRSSEASDTSSDKRLKNTIEDLPESLLDVWFDFVKPKSFKLNNSEDGGKHCGVIAQDVIAAFDNAGLNWKDYEIVSEGEDGMLGVRYEHVQIIEMAAIRKKLGL